VKLAFTVPVKPIGVNAAYKPVRWGNRVGFAKTGECLAYQDAIVLAARRAMGAQKWLSMEGRAAVNVRFYFATLGSDIDGPIKPTLDAIAKAGVVWNDNRVRELHVYKPDPDGRERVEVEVVEL